MDQEKFIGKYVELLNSTLTESFQKNIVAQAQKRTLEDELALSEGENSKKEETIKSLSSELGRLKEQLNGERTKIVGLNGEVSKITGLNQQIEQLKNVILIKQQLNVELEKSLSEKDVKIESLNKTIDELNTRIKSIIEEKPIVLQNNIKRKPATTKLSKASAAKPKTSNTITKDAGNF
jgi:chromosome segregation ATPase